MTAIGQADRMSINTMTWDPAVAIGELVDDARSPMSEEHSSKAQENRVVENPKPTLLVVFQASTEVLQPDSVFSTMIRLLHSSS